MTDESLLITIKRKVFAFVDPRWTEAIELFEDMGLGLFEEEEESRGGRGGGGGRGARGGRGKGRGRKK